MRGYYSYFKKIVISGLQYRAAAISGLATQYFWGMIFAMIYTNFYSYTSLSNITIEELMAYVWLNQAFFTFTNLMVKDPFILNSIKTGEVAYELVRPTNLYWWWYLKMLANRYSAVALRVFPILIFSLVLPKPFNLILPNSLPTFLLFLVSLFFSSLLVVSINMIVTTISFFSNEDKGISSFVYSIGQIFSGVVVPLPLLPKLFNNISDILPFKHLNDTVFRIYSGHIPLNDAVTTMTYQFMWIIILILFGFLLMRKALTKVSVQGG